MRAAGSRCWSGGRLRRGGIHDGVDTYLVEDVLICVPTIHYSVVAREPSLSQLLDIDSDDSGGNR